MPFRLLKDGTIECDTLHELRMLQAGNDDSSKREATGTECNGKASATNKEAAYTAFWAELEERGKAVLRALAARSNEQVRAEELATSVGIQTAKLPAPMIHIRGVAKRAGIPAPIDRTKRMEGNKLRSRYQISRKVLEGLKHELKPA